MPVGSVMAFGCVVDFAVGKSGLVHVSELDTSRTADATASWKVGDRMDVKILDYEKASGRCKLSRYCLDIKFPSVHVISMCDSLSLWMQCTVGLLLVESLCSDSLYVFAAHLGLSSTSGVLSLC